MLKYLSDRLYHSVRGKGLTYSISMSLSVSTGRVVLGLSKSSQLTGAYKAVREILTNYTQVNIFTHEYESCVSFYNAYLVGFDGVG